VRIVAECAVCGHGSNHVTALAYSVNRGNTGDWRWGRREAETVLASKDDFGDRRGVMAGAERAATKSWRGGIAATGSYWIPEDKKVSKEFSKPAICVIYVPSRRIRAPLASQAAGKSSAPECV
jgi:hypothetical protein